MSLRRVACLVSFPLAFVAYACSSDDNTAPNNGIDAGIDGSIEVPGPKTDGGTDIDSSDQPTDEAGADAGDAGDAAAIEHPASCDENPLAAGDAGAVIFDSDGGGLTEVTTGPFLDGVQWTDDGVVYSEVTGQVVVKNGPDGGARTVFRTTASGNDLPIGNARSGDFIYTAVSHTTGKGAVLRTQLDGGAPTSIDPGAANPSDIVVSSKGIVYFTDGALIDETSVVTGIYSISADGSTVTTISRVQNDAGATKKAKGIALNADESALFVAYYDDKRIEKWTLDAAGLATNPTNVAATLADNPVGIALDNAGNIWVAESPMGADLHGRVEVFSSTGAKWGEIPFNDARPTDVAFGGADGMTVYVTTERGAAGPGSPATFGSLYKLTTRCPGVR